MIRCHAARWLGAALALIAVVSLVLAVGTAYGYYTDTSRANGKIPFSFNPDPPKTEVSEDPDGLDKIISVENTGDVPAMARVKVFVPSISGMTVEFEAGAGWTQEVTGDADRHNDEGWWYYVVPIAPGEATPALTVHVEIESASLSEPFDIVVVQQAASAKSYSAEDGVLGAFADGLKRMDVPLPIGDLLAEDILGEPMKAGE